MQAVLDARHPKFFEEVVRPSRVSQVRSWPTIRWSRRSDMTMMVTDGWLTPIIVLAEYS